MRWEIFVPRSFHALYAKLHFTTSFYILFFCKVRRESLRVLGNFCPKKLSRVMIGLRNVTGLRISSEERLLFNRVLRSAVFTHYRVALVSFFFLFFFFFTLSKENTEILSKSMPRRRRRRFVREISGQQ